MGRRLAGTAFHVHGARIVYRLIKHGETYVRQGLDIYEKTFRARKVRALQKTARTMGYELIEKQAVPT